MSKSAVLARRVRHQRWAEIIKACESRPVGMSVARWCRENNIKESTYYSRLHRVKEAFLETIEPTFSDNSMIESRSLNPVIQTEPTFVELHAPTVSNYPPAMVISCGNAKVEINESISDEFLTRVFKAVSNA